MRARLPDRHISGRHGQRARALLQSIGVRIGIGAAAIASTAAALAHGPAEARFPVLRCEDRAAIVQCEVRWSDGSQHPSAPLTVLARDGSVLLAGQSRPGQAFRFARPNQPWAIMLHSTADGGQTVELAGQNIPPAPQATPVHGGPPGEGP